MRDKTSFAEKLKTLGELAELGGEDPIIGQTITKLLDYATERHQKDLEDLAAKLRTIRGAVWDDVGPVLPAIPARRTRG